MSTGINIPDLGIKIKSNISNKQLEKNAQAVSKALREGKPIPNFNATSAQDQRAMDLRQGKEFVQSTLGKDGLGRLQEGQLGRLGDDKDISEALGRFKDIADQGLSRQEVSQQRAEAMGAIQGQTQTDLRGLQSRLAQSGVRGETAGNLLLRRQLQGADQAAGVERDLFLRSEQLKRQGLQDYSSRLGELKSFDLSQANREQEFNLANAAREKSLAVQGGLTFAQMGASERSAELAAEKAKEAEIAAAQAAGGGGGGGTIICSELLRQKRISKSLRERALAYSKKVSPTTYNGYLNWAAPVVEKMQTSKVVTNLVEIFVLPAILYMGGHKSIVNYLTFKTFCAFSNVVGLLTLGKKRNAIQ